jgi:hypothetical protein
LTEVINGLPGVIKGLWYRTDAEGLVVVIDSDRSAVHSSEHDKLDEPPNNCRLCQLCTIIADTRAQLKPV